MRIPIPSKSPTLTDAHRRSPTLTDAHRRSPTLTDAHRRSPTLTDEEYGEKYLRSRLRIGRIHHAIGLSPQWYVGAYSIYTQLIFPHVVAAFRPDFALAQKAFGSLLKLVLLDTELALTAYIAAEAKKRAG